MRVYQIIGCVAALATVCGSALAQQPGRRQGFGGRGGFGGGVVGTIQQVDATKGTVQIQTAGPQAGSRTVAFTAETPIFRQSQGTLADLKVNDTIQVSGMPTAITALRLQVGELPPPAVGGFGGGGQGGNARGAAGAGPGRPGGPMVGTANATGTIVSTSPLVVQLPGSVRVTVTADPSTRVTKMVKTTAADLKVGDTIRATGRPGDDGNLTAVQIQVGIDPNAGFGGRGFGGNGLQRRPGGANGNGAANGRRRAAE
jgi:Domain of unknown function (DUF5666)